MQTLSFQAELHASHSHRFRLLLHAARLFISLVGVSVYWAHRWIGRLHKNGRTDREPCGPMELCIKWGSHRRQLANTTEWCVHCGEVALSEITLCTCHVTGILFWSYSTQKPLGITLEAKRPLSTKHQCHRTDGNSEYRIQLVSSVLRPLNNA